MTGLATREAERTSGPVASPASGERLAPTLVLAAVVLLGGWMGYESGGYFVGGWVPVALILAGLLLVAAAGGVLRGTGSRWATLALGLFAGYTALTFASLYWSPNRGDAWVGAGQTLLYLLAFGAAVAFVVLGASRRRVLAASVLGTGAVSLLTLLTLLPRAGELFLYDRLIGTVGYHNGEAAFLLVPLWAAIYLAGSRRTHPVLRGAVLAAATLCAQAAFLTQSRGAMVALAVSVPVFFLLSGRRLRGLLALAPVAVAVAVAAPDLNAVYQESLDGGSAVAALESVLPTVWMTAAGAGLYGLLWGLADRRWRPPAVVARGFGVLVLAGVAVALLVGGSAAVERVGDPVAWGEQRWEAFKANDEAGMDESRYLSASGSGRYVLWQVAWEDFAGSPLLGVGTHNYEATYYQLREETGGWVRQPHMLPLEVLGERGAVGGVLFAGFLATCVLGGLWWRFRGLNPEGRAQAGALLAAVTYWAVHSGVEWFWQIPAVTLPAMVYLGLLVAPWRGARQAPLRWPSRTGIAVAAVFAIALLSPLYVADRYLAQSYAITDLDGALAAVERAERFNPVSPSIPRREAELAARAGDDTRAEKAHLRAISLNPEHFAPYALLAAYYQESGDLDRALGVYREALERNPLDEDLARVVEELGETEPR